MKRINTETIQTILSRKKAGETVADLAAEYHIGTSTIWKWNRLYGNRLTNHFSKVNLIDSSNVTFKLNGHEIEIEKNHLREFIRAIL